jgi:succinoglycan biosynthesis protein ExoV
VNLFFFRGEKPNFGDELNTWMWPKLIEGVWDKNDNSMFIGIGSVIYNNFPADKKKIIFGAGYGGYTPLPILDDSWKFYFVRGKLTTKALGIDEKLGIGDSAILLRSLVKQKVAKRYKVSFIPHWKSTFEGNWALACELASINYIDPCQPVEKVTDSILASELIITEAMHGAIVSDALRVPWVPIQPLGSIHEMKWFDWASALNIDLKPLQMKSSSLLEATTLFFDERNPSMADRFRRRGRFLLNVAPQLFAQRAAKRLVAISKNDPSLSSDLSIESSHNQMLSKLEELVHDLGKGKLIC